MAYLLHYIENITRKRIHPSKTWALNPLSSIMILILLCTPTRFVDILQKSASSVACSMDHTVIFCNVKMLHTY
jgi:hypothetical protein